MRVEYSDAARKQLRKLDKSTKSRILDYMDEVAAYVDYVFFKFTTERKKAVAKSEKKGFGGLKDIPCRMAPNFDDPLEDFK